MEEQTAVLVQDHGEWVLVIDSDEDEPERTWPDLDAAMKELRQGGSQVVPGFAPIRPSMARLDRFDAYNEKMARASLFLTNVS